MNFSLILRRFLTLFSLLLLLSHFALAQVPSGMNYQAVVRDGQDVLANQLMGVEFSVFQDSSEVYKETQIITSNEYGLIHAIIGEGNSINGNLDSLDWSSGSYTLKVSIDAGGGFEELGEMALTSVPYSGFSKQVSNLENLNIYTPSNGRIGIGTESPSSSLGINGDISLENASGLVGTRVYDWGGLQIYGDNGKRNALLTYRSGHRNKGSFELNNDDGDYRAFLQVTPVGCGALSLFGDNGNEMIAIGYTGTTGNNGYIATRDETGTTRASMSASTSGGGTGFSVTYGPNGNRNAAMSWLSGNNNNGFLSVRDAGNTTQAGIYVNSSGDGVVFGDVKNFRMEHPTQVGKEIWYACIEGPEAAAYERGTAKLVKGKALVDFSDHFKMVSSSKGMTVILTPLSGASEGLAVINKSETGFEVVELRNGTGTYEFDWEVKVIRTGYENYRVIRDAIEAQPGDENMTLEEIEQK